MENDTLKKEIGDALKKVKFSAIDLYEKAAETHTKRLNAAVEAGNQKEITRQRGLLKRAERSLAYYRDKAAGRPAQQEAN